VVRLKPDCDINPFKHEHLHAEVLSGCLDKKGTEMRILESRRTLRHGPTQPSTDKRGGLRRHWHLALILVLGLSTFACFGPSIAESFERFDTLEHFAESRHRHLRLS
jgi:hypothetical protein